MNDYELIQELVKLPHWKVFERMLSQSVAEFRAKPLDRSGNIEAQALAKEDAENLINSLIRNITALGAPTKERDETYE